MSFYYDHINNSISVPHTYEEYVKALKKSPTIQYWVSPNDDIDFRTKYRHEHAHFSSYNSTGLIEFQALFSDFKLLLLVSMYRWHLETSGLVAIPIIEKTGHLSLSEIDTLFLKVWNQINTQEAYIFGWGSDQSIAQLFRLNDIDILLEKLRLSQGLTSVSRFRRLLKQLTFTSPINQIQNPQIAHPSVQTRSGEIVKISTRAILEAYAISVETISEYYKTIKTSLNPNQERVKRKPNVNYLLVIEGVLDVITNDSDTIILEDFIHGKLPNTSLYWGVNIITMAAMQVPVLEDVEGDSICMGSLKQLHPAHRLVHILTSIHNGSLQNPLEIRNFYDNEVVRDWINKCHKSIGDPWSLKFYEHVQLIVTSLSDQYSNAKNHSMHKTAWAGRHNWMKDPSSFVMEAGILNEEYGFHIDYVKTSDGKILSGYEGSDEAILMSYLLQSSSYILEGCLLGDRWESSWLKFGICNNDDQKKDYFKIVVTHYLDRLIGTQERSLETLVVKDSFKSKA